MKQPELGKKILELRLAKGLTQSELAEKCNIGLRTIQRIESAEVTPRSYTLKLIFESLDYEMFNSSRRSSFKSAKTRLQSLFSLKMHTLRILAAVSVPCILIIIFFSLTGFQENKELGPYSITELNQKYIDWFNSGQIDSLVLIYQKDACFIPYNHAEIYGRKNIKKYYHSLYDSGFRMYKSESKEVIVTDSITVERGVWHANNTINFTGTYLAQWRLSSNGRWYIENSMSNGDFLN